MNAAIKNTLNYTLKNALVVLCIIQFAIIVFLQQCQRCPEVKPTLTITIDTLKTIDTAEIAGPWRPYPVYTEVEAPKHDTVNLSKEDSIRIVSDYAKLRHYNLPVIDDTNGKINIFADVQFNMISKWRYEGQMFTKTITIEKNHVYTVTTKNRLFVGFLAGTIRNENILYPSPTSPPVTEITHGFTLSPQVTLITKKSNFYTITYDPFNRIAQIGLSFMLFKR
jgi:hypothetical protein